VGVEPTILAAKDRINGFEGHEDHRTPFASVGYYTEAVRRAKHSVRHTGMLSAMAALRQMTNVTQHWARE
jgi:hypothetical protein